MFVLNSFDDNIKFTYEQENNNRLLFLDVLFIRDYEKINATVFRKDTHNYLYLHWELFSSISWKRGTLKLLISRAYIYIYVIIIITIIIITSLLYISFMICSIQSLLEMELEHF